MPSNNCGNKVDRKAPAIAVNTPAATVYLLNQNVNVNYTCSDGGSGVSTCSGTVPNGANLDTKSVGAKTFTVTAMDAR